MENHFWTMAIDRYFSSMRSTPRIAGPTLGSLIPKEEGRADLGCRMHRTGSANEVRPDNPSFKLQPAKLNPERCFFDTNLNQEKFPLNMQYLFDIATMNCDPADFDSPEVILVLFLLEHFPCLDQIVASWQWSEICEVIVGEGVNQVPVASRGANERALEAILENQRAVIRSCMRYPYLLDSFAFRCQSNDKRTFSEMPPISPQKVIGMAYLLLQNYHESKPPYQKRKIREVAVAIFPFYGKKWRRHFIKNSNEASNFDVLYDTIYSFQNPPVRPDFQEVTKIRRALRDLVNLFDIGDFTYSKQLILEVIDDMRK